MTLGRAVSAFVAKRPHDASASARVLWLLLQAQRPRLARALLPALVRAPIAQAVDALTSSTIAVPAALTEVLLALPPLPALPSLAAVVHVSDIDIDELVADIDEGPFSRVLSMRAGEACETVLGMSVFHVASGNIGWRRLRDLASDVQADVEDRQAALHLLQVVAAITTALPLSPVWPVLLNDSVGVLSERRAFLDVAGPRRGGIWRAFRTPILKTKVGERTLTVWPEGSHGITIDLVELSIEAGAAFAQEAAWAYVYDIVNEPDDEDAALLRRCFADGGTALLDALFALTVPKADDVDERLVWHLAIDWSVRIRCRKQKRSRTGKWSKGTEIDPAKVLGEFRALADEQDQRVAALLSNHRAAPHDALLALVGHQRLVGDDNELIVLSEHALQVAIVDDEAGHKVQLRLDGFDVSPDQVHGGMVLLHDQHLRHLRIGLVNDRWQRVVVALRKQSVVPLGSRLALEHLADAVVVHQAPVVLPPSLQGDLIEATPTLVLRLALTEVCTLEATVGVLAGPGATFRLPGDADVALATVNGQRVRYGRNTVDEQQRAGPVLEQLGHDLATVSLVDAWTVTAKNDDALAMLQRAQICGVEVVWRDQRRLQVQTGVGAQRLKVRVRQAGHWLGLEGSLVVDNDAVTLAELLAAAREHRRFVRLADDHYVALDDALRDGLRTVADLTIDSGNGTIEVPLAVAPALGVLHERGAVLEEGEVWQTLAARLDRARAVDDDVPAGLSATLRPYQQEGLLFLRRLAAFGTGGVLADDMGLGKTVQAVGLLVDRKELGPAVVVAPTSVVFNWRRELERFAPSLRVLLYGDVAIADRGALLQTLGPRDVLVVSYGLLDGDGFDGTSFATAIFDEAQAFKNADTQRARACRDLQAELKIALSGTPLENHLGELWSLFRVVCPGLLGSQEQFRKRFLLPIERDRSFAHRRQLGQALRPFLLRRTKAEVLTDLPALTHQLVDVDAGAAEKQLYEALRSEVITALNDDGPNNERRFRVLAGLTRLRLCCCHPVLVDPTWEGPAAKLEEAIATLQRVKEAGHKALVFSQFVRFLDLVEPAAQSAGLRTLRLDGSTPEALRRTRVDAFQRGDADVFFLSLKAGGAGLNLTNADVVVHLDPWWNPAVESQAIARAHRMGRSEPVTAIRLVVRHTIEEAILRMHDDKRELVDAVLAGAAAGGGLDLEEIATLLQAPT